MLCLTGAPWCILKQLRREEVERRRHERAAQAHDETQVRARARCLPTNQSRAGVQMWCVVADVFKGKSIRGDFYRKIVRHTCAISHVLNFHHFQLEVDLVWLCEPFGVG